MALAYMHKGMYDKAMDLQIETAVAIGDPTRIAVVRRLTDSYRANGLEGYIRELVEVEMEDNPDRDSYRIAECYALLGQKDMAFQYLDRAYELHFSDLLSMNADPELDSLPRIRGSSPYGVE